MDHANQKRCFSYVDALLEEEEEDGGGGEPNSKRRRLALTLVRDTKQTPAINKAPLPVEKKRNIILDPRSRLVQESLESVFCGKVTIAQHLDFIAQRFATLRYSSRVVGMARRAQQWQCLACCRTTQ